MTYTLHHCSQHSKQDGREDNGLFLFRDDLDAVLEALEANDIVDESFNEAVTEVREIIPEFFV